jgi:hypothetical protein
LTQTPLTTHNIHKILTSKTPARFEPAIPETEWPQTHTLDRTATGISLNEYQGRKTSVPILKHATSNIKFSGSKYITDKL